MTNEPDVNANPSSAKAGDPNAEGEKRKMPDGRTIEDVWAENQRKGEENQSLKAQLEEVQERLDKLDEIEERRKLTEREQAEQADLTDDVKSLAKKLRSQADAKPWLHIVDEETRKVKDSVLDMDLKRANFFIHKMAKVEKMDGKELLKSLSQFSSKYDEEIPSIKYELAYEDWKESKTRLTTLEEREKALKEKEAADMLFRETGTRLPKDNTFVESFNSAKTPQERSRMIVEMMSKKGQK